MFKKKIDKTEFFTAKEAKIRLDEAKVRLMKSEVGKIIKILKERLTENIDKGWNSATYGNSYGEQCDSGHFFFIKEYFQELGYKVEFKNKSSYVSQSVLSYNVPAGLWGTTVTNGTITGTSVSLPNHNEITISFDK